AVKQRQFIEEISSAREQEVARAQLRQMIAYAESGECRRTSLLAYFGENREEPQCDACDNCLEPRDTFDGTIETLKFLSCVYRVGQSRVARTGLNHIVDILLGSQAEKIRSWGHDALSTHGIGADLPRGHWQAVGRQLIAKGFLEMAPGKFSTVGLTEEGRAVLRERRPVTLVRPLLTSEALVRKPKAGEIECDEILFERLRGVRKRLADAIGKPAYIIFGDVTLREMARVYPENEDELGRIPGVGERKLAEYGPAFLEEIRAYRAGPGIGSGRVGG
ncbi:MAG: DNA helicase RecQ, partial [Puniceicoccaceae bacterium]